MFNFKSAFISTFFGFLVLLPGLSLADAGDFYPSRAGITFQTNPYGTQGSIEFNRFTDANNSVAVSRRHGEEPEYADERDFTAARKILTDPIADQNEKYEHRIDNLELGDRVWVQVYLHNNAQQVCGGGNIAQNTTARIDWSDPTALVARITADNASPQEINDIVNFSFSGDYSFQRVEEVRLFDRVDPDAGSCHSGDLSYKETNPTPAVETGVSSQINLGGMSGSYGHIKLIYFQLEVVPAQRNMAIVQTAVPAGGESVEALTGIDYAFTVNNTGNVGLENVIVTDILDQNLEYQDSPDATANGQTVSLNYGVLGADPLARIFTAQVRGNTPDGAAICNAGIGTADGVTAVNSNEICHTVTNPGTPDSGFGITKRFEYWVDRDSNEVLSPGDEIAYVVNIQNTATDSSIENVTITDLPDENLTLNTGPTYNIGTLPPQTGVNQRVIVSVNAGVADGVEVCNRASVTGFRNNILIVPATNNPTAPVCLTVGEPPSFPDPEFLLDKQFGAPVWIDRNGDNALNAGDEINYVVRVQNTSTDQSLDQVVATDVPDEHLLLIEDTLDGIINFGNLPAQAIKIENLKVRIRSNVPAGTQVCNTVSALGQRNGQLVHPANNNPTAPICLTTSNPDEDGGDDDGGAPSHPTIGACTVNYSTGALQCTPRYPVEDPSDPTWQAYRECKNDSTKTIKQCLQEWATSRDIITCGDGAMNNVDIPYTGSQNADLIAQCADLMPRPKGPCTNGTNSTFIKKIKMTDGNFGEETRVAKGEKVTYRATVEINGSDVPEVTQANLRVYDFTIPAESGNVWNRNGFISEGWGWNTGGRYYEKILSTGELADLNAGNPVRTSVDYQMDTELAANYDVSNIKNVGFAVLRYNGGPDMIGIGNACGISGATINGLFMSSTLGDDANINIIRPYVEAKGGDIGFRFSQNTIERITGDAQVIAGEEQTTGKVFVEEEMAEDPEKGFLARFTGSVRQIISDLSIFEKFKEASEAEAFYENLKLNLDQENKINVLGTNFVTTPDNSGVYFVDTAETQDVHFNTDLDLGGTSKTFVIEDRDLIIGDLLGQKKNYALTNGFAAFVVRNGNVKIRPHVESLEGIFIVEDGNIMPTDKYDSGLSFWLPEISRRPLTVSGMLVGDVQDLFNYRRYIGDDPEMAVAPSIIINFDLRTIENTPPSLEKFLGSSWRQEMMDSAPKPIETEETETIEKVEETPAEEIPMADDDLSAKETPVEKPVEEASETTEVKSAENNEK